MEGTQVGRLLSADYLILVNGAALLFNLLLIWKRRWAELAVFNAAATVNILLELILISKGLRQFAPGDFLHSAGALACLGWSDNGIFACTAYMNVRWLLKRDYPGGMLLALNAFYFIGLPLLSVNYGLFGLEGVHTWRTAPPAGHYAGLAVVCVFAAVMLFTRKQRVLGCIMAVGMLMELAFEARLFLVGVRPMPEHGNMFMAVMHNVTEFKFPMAMLIGFLVIQLIFRPKETQDPAPAG